MSLNYFLSIYGLVTGAFLSCIPARSNASIDARQERDMSRVDLPVTTEAPVKTITALPLSQSKCKLVSR